jgi:predicted transcriptional regulator
MDTPRTYNDLVDWINLHWEHGDNVAVAKKLGISESAVCQAIHKDKDKRRCKSRRVVYEMVRHINARIKMLDKLAKYARKEPVKFLNA